MKHRIRTGVAASIGMLLLILDTKTALYGANEGIHLCLMTVIPSLLPFIFLSNLLTSALSGTKLPILRIFGRCMRMPYGSESLFLIGALGGYPTGAQAVSTAYHSGQLTKTDARRLLGFCSNAGPSFLFGITAAQFPDALTPWFLWLVHLLSAFATGIILPGCSRSEAALQQGRTLTLVESLRRSIAVMAQICAWIILFRVILAFLNRWFLWLLGNDTQIMITGLAELSLGCTSLSGIHCQGLRFIVTAALLGFGGLCVMMQTASAVGSLGLGMYIPGKIIQCCISIVLAGFLQKLLYLPDQQVDLHPLFYLILLSIPAVIVFLLQKKQKRCSNPQLLAV